MTAAHEGLKIAQSNRMAISGVSVFDVIIAYFNETWWLVHGVKHLDAMLAAQEPPDLQIEIVTCDAWVNVMQLWDEQEEGKLPWAINPRVIERLKSRERTSSS